MKTKVVIKHDDLENFFDTFKSTLLEIVDGNGDLVLDTLDDVPMAKWDFDQTKAISALTVRLTTIAYEFFDFAPLIK